MSLSCSSIKNSVSPNPKTPRDHLSWSQIRLFEYSEAAYVAKYLEGREYINEQMNFGKRIAKGLEQKETDDMEVEHIRLFLPSYPKTEYEIQVLYQDIPLIGRFDKCDPRKRRIGEVKTGGAPWTQRRVDQDGQLTFYAWLFFMKYGHIPALELYWAPTVREESGIRLSGEIKTFQTERSLTGFGRMARRSIAVWEGIKRVTKNFYLNQ